jgi:hypothetical protein
MPGPLSSKAGPSNTRAYLSDLIDSYCEATKAEDAARIELEIRAYLKDQPNHQGIYNKLIIEKEVPSDHAQLRALATNARVQYYNDGFAATVAAGAAAGGKRRSQKTRKHSKKGNKAKKGTRSQRGSGLYGNFMRALRLKPINGEDAVKDLVKTLQGEGGVALARELSRITKELNGIQKRGGGSLQLSLRIAQALFQVQGAMVSWKSMSAEEKKKVLEEAAVKAHWQGRVTNEGAVGRNKQSRVANYLSKPDNFKRTNSVAIKQQEIFDQIMSQVEGYEPIEIPFNVPQVGGTIGKGTVSRYVSVRLEGDKLRPFLFLFGVFLIVLRTAMLSTYYISYTLWYIMSLGFVLAAVSGSNPGETALASRGVNITAPSSGTSGSILPTFTDALILMGLLSPNNHEDKSQKSQELWVRKGPDYHGIYWYEQYNYITGKVEDDPLQLWKRKIDGNHYYYYENISEIDGMHGVTTYTTPPMEKSNYPYWWNPKESRMPYQL